MSSNTEKKQQQQQLDLEHLLNSTFNSAQLLSIPSQQGEPPNHSTPKRSSDLVRPPSLCESTICDDFDQNVDISTKDELGKYFDNELMKRYSSTNVYKDDGSTSTNVLNQGMLRPAGQSMRSSLTSQLNSLTPATTTNSGASAYNHRKMPKFEKEQHPHEMQPFAGRPISSRASDVETISSGGLLGIERNKSVLNYGFVPIGQSLPICQRIWNHDKAKMLIKCSILSTDNDDVLENSPFKITSVSTPAMSPGECCEITVLYEPTKMGRDVARLAVERENGPRIRYSFSLIGTGGTSQLCLDRIFQSGMAQQSTSGRVIVIRPDIFERFWLHFENRGERPAFVSLIAADPNGNILTRQAGQQQVTIKPVQFVLESPSGKAEDGQKRHEKKVLVCVDKSYNWLDPNTTIGGNVLRPQDGSGRNSMLSSASNAAPSTGNGVHNPQFAYQIMAYWSEECRRQRLKLWEKKSCKQFDMDGFRFTGTFEGEQPLGTEKRMRMMESVRDEDVREFSESIRIIKFNVVDDRARTVFPTPSNALQSLNNWHAQNGRMIKEVFSNGAGGSSDLTYINGSYNNTTMGGGGQNTTGHHQTTMMPAWSPNRGVGDGTTSRRTLAPSKAFAAQANRKATK